MRVAIDAAGRIVVPKALRDELGLTPGTELEISAGDRGLEVVVAPTPMRLEEHGHGVVAVADRQLPVLTAEEVRRTLERVRR